MPPMRTILRNIETIFRAHPGYLGVEWVDEDRERFDLD